jgi:hypothetical protein
LVLKIKYFFFSESEADILTTDEVLINESNIFYRSAVSAAVSHPHVRCKKNLISVYVLKVLMFILNVILIKVYYVFKNFKV